jgi:hypothetical protein
MAAEVRSVSGRFEVSDVRPLFAVNLYVQRPGYYAYDVAPDGQRFLMENAGDEERPRVVLLMNRAFGSSP